MTPTLYVTNWPSIHRDNHREASGEARIYSGPEGQHYSIMTKPRPQYGETGDGKVYVLLPSPTDLDAVKAGRMTVADYRERYVAGVRRLSQGLQLLRPGRTWEHMHAHILGPHGLVWRPVADGSTLACACSRDAAADGKCHRVWAAGLLIDAGWRVVLDGRPLARVDDNGRPLFAERAQ